MSLKIEKTGLFAIKEKTRARMRTVSLRRGVSPMCTRFVRVHTHVRYADTLTRAAAAADISRRNVSEHTR